MLNKQKLFEALNAMTDSRRMDALAILGYLLLQGPTEPHKLRQLSPAFLDGHPMYLGSLLQTLQEWGAIDYEGLPAPVVGVCAHVSTPVLTDSLAALKVPHVVGHDVYRLVERDRVLPAEDLAG